MAATSDEEMESLLSSFDEIYDNVKNGITQIQSLQSTCNAEVKKREALQITASSLKSDNERLTKLYTESLNKLSDQLERRTNCQSLKEQLEKVRDALLRKENEYSKAMESLKQDCSAKIKDLKNQIRGFLIQKAEDEAIIKQLHEDLTVHKTHLESQTSRLERVHFDVESKYHYENQDLKDCLMVEEEEKTELHKKLQNLEKELLISRTKLVEHHRDSISNRHVETLKQKIMKLRKENEVLKRQLHGSREG
ncbi:protein At-4/1 [Actinidia eriantha]|uniref:protein At-4/1 n=1 Tax=Actinidia eriantha TaxID=165200 RepID=UPI0025856EBD|nr:protein At-4/1 [Actinidia eriantha]XP_057485169.1 protein At-4/1 [Actinidia eriantha]